MGGKESFFLVTLSLSKGLAEGAELFESHLLSLVLNLIFIIFSWFFSTFFLQHSEDDITYNLGFDWNQTQDLGKYQPPRLKEKRRII